MFKPFSKSPLAHVGLALLWAILAPSVSFGDLVRYNFAGTLDTVQTTSASFASDVAAGATFRGTFLFDDSVAANAGIANLYQDAIREYNVDVGGSSFLSSQVLNQYPAPGNFLTITNDDPFGSVPFDAFSAEVRSTTVANAGLNSQSSLRLNLYDPSGTAFSSATLAGKRPSLANFNLARLSFSESTTQGFSGPVVTSRAFFGSITSLVLTTSVVPEPGSLGLLAGGAVCVGWLRRGRSRRQRRA